MPGRLPARRLYKSSGEALRRHLIRYPSFASPGKLSPFNSYNKISFDILPSLPQRFRPFPYKLVTHPTSYLYSEILSLESLKKLYFFAKNDQQHSVLHELVIESHRAQRTFLAGGLLFEPVPAHRKYSFEVPRRSSTETACILVDRTAQVCCRYLS